MNELQSLKIIYVLPFFFLVSETILILYFLKGEDNKYEQYMNDIFITGFIIAFVGTLLRVSNLVLLSVVPLAAALVVDIKIREIPDTSIVVSTIFALSLAIYNFNYYISQNAIFAIAIFITLLVLALTTNTTGLGDVKLCVPVLLIALGAHCFLEYLLWLWVAMALSLLVYASSKNKDGFVPFAPIMIAALFIAII